MTILLCEPIKEAILNGNTDIHYHLYESYVNYHKALEQHKQLQSILKQQQEGITLIQSKIPSYIPIKEYSNFMFVRDTFIKTKKGLVLGRMKEPIRQMEIELMDWMLNSLGQTIIYKMEAPEILEGGDFVFFEDISFIATGTRSNALAVSKLMSYNLLGTSKVAMIYTDQPDPNMSRIHLDCYFAPFSDRYCVLWEELIRCQTPYQRYVAEYIQQPNGTYQKTMDRMPFFEYLIKNHFNVIPISTQAQTKYGCNILELSNGTILTQEEESHRKIKNSILVPLDEIHKMYGGIHCITNTL